MTKRGNCKAAHAASSDSPNRYVELMNDALRKQYKSIHNLLVEADTNNNRSRYKIAVLCLRVRDGDGMEKTYGERAVNQLANALGKKKTWVYDWARVPDAWDAKHFEKLVARKDRFKKPLSWSHFVALSVVKDASERERLTEESLTRGWTVRELTKALRGRRNVEQAGSSEGQASATDRSRELERTVRGYTAQLAPFANLAAWGENLRDQIASSQPENCTDDLLDQLRDVRKSLEQKCLANIELFDACIAKAEETRSHNDQVSKIDQFRQDEDYEANQMAEEQPVGV